MLSLITYHGTAEGEPLVGGQDPVSNQTLECLWVSNSYFLASQSASSRFSVYQITLS